MGVGKSTVGRALAARLGLPFEDTDAILVARHGPIPAQLASDGEPTFRARERAVVEALAAGPACVVATGGGVWADARNREALRPGFRRIVLHAPIEVLAARVGGDPSRPLWDDAVQARYEARRAAYADADLAVDVAYRDVGAIVEEIAGWLASNP
jgi:shikimate kinase